MPRSPRVFVADGMYHIMSRGSDRQMVFVFDGDRLAFLERLAVTVERFALSCVAYCLMGNHYHLVVQTGDGRLSKAMQELNGGYSREFNRTHGRSAHLFRNRFKAREIIDEADLLGVCSYVARNPVRAGLCGDPDEWPWGSHRATVGLQPIPPFLDETLLHDACGADRDWRRRYQAFVAQAPAPVDNPTHTRHASPLTAAGA